MQLALSHLSKFLSWQKVLALVDLNKELCDTNHLTYLVAIKQGRRRAKFS